MGRRVWEWEEDVSGEDGVGVGGGCRWEGGCGSGRRM